MTLAITGKVWVFGDDLNTDAMYPAFAMKMEPPEAAKHIFYEGRPGWTDEVSPGDIVLAGRNFGVGSSRPVAALFFELGVAGLVAEEFNSLFFRNADKRRKGRWCQYFTTAELDRPAVRNPPGGVDHRRCRRPAAPPAAAHGRG